MFHWQAEKFRHQNLDTVVSPDWPENPIPELLKAESAESLLLALKEEPGGLRFDCDRSVGGTLGLIYEVKS
jgi:hypothetical protein|tara:strand:- start:2109 stop:2321 length:213 start_codon:yes stop_codon:yes gene_type:complete